MEEDPGAIAYGSQSQPYPLPPLDCEFFPDDIPLPDSLAADLDFDFDFDFSFDDLQIPYDADAAAEADDFLLDAPVSANPNDSVPNSQRSDISSSGDRTWDDAAAAAASSGMNPHSPASSHASGNCDVSSGASQAEKSVLYGPDGSGCGSIPSSPDLDAKPSSHAVDIEKIKLEEAVKTPNSSVSKRKKEPDDERNSDCRTSKFRRSAVSENSGSENQGYCGEDEKRKARLMRNRESAQLSRQRKKHYVEELEDKVRTMHSTIQDLNGKISYFMAENASLRQQMSGGGMCQTPPPGMYPHPPMAPMGYPWMHCPPYVVKSQGSQVPLVPIPRLKPQKTVSPARTKKTETKKTETKKSEGRTKKVASVSYLGLLFFVLMFGGLVSMFNIKYGGDGVNSLYGSDYISSKFYSPYRGRVLTVNSHVNGSKKTNEIDSCGGNSVLKEAVFHGNKCGRGPIGEPEIDVENRGRASRSRTDEPDHVRNASKPLVASLYVPRNDKLVKIDGNLIIHSVLASEKAMASHAASDGKIKRETGLAIARAVPSTFTMPDGRRMDKRHPYVYNTPTQKKKALISSSAEKFRDKSKSPAADGKLQQWFREGLAGPMLSSGMCTEVFQFDVSPASAPGGMISSSSVTNITSERPSNSTHMKRSRNRRVLHSLPIPFPGSKINATSKPVEDSFEGNRTRSSVVVSVLVDPREAGEVDSDGILRPKSLPQIFVVVLLDSVKYVTYSCVLPLKGFATHLVTH